MTRFDEWFIAQHGKRPTTVDLMRLRDRVVSQREVLASDEGLLRALEEWEARRTSALWAWRVRDEQKGSTK